MHQHLETLKHIGDVASLSAVIAYWLGLFAAVAAPLSIIIGLIDTSASAVWFTFRAIDMYWVVKEHYERRKKEDSVRNPSD